MWFAHSLISITAAAVIGANCILGSLASADDIWLPEVNTTWQWQLQYQINTSFDVDMYDIDLFDVPVSVMDEIKDKGSKVICYFSAGSYESWRDDASDFPEEALGKPMEGWEDELWVDVNHEGIRAVMAARLDLAVAKGCDGVEPDNMQVYVEGSGTGVSVTADEQADYSIFLAAEAHSRKLSIGLKNDIDHVQDLEPFFDWAINESCFEWGECDEYESTFIANGKAVFHTEYEWHNLTFCTGANEMGLSSLLKSYDLGDARCSCQDPDTNNQCALLLEDGYVPAPSPAPEESGAQRRFVSLFEPKGVRGVVPFVGAGITAAAAVFATLCI